MNVDSYLERVYAEGRQHDALATKRSEMMLNITPSTGRFLDLLLSEIRPTRILELGTSNGYSTIWLARAAHRIGSKVDSVDNSRRKVELAAQHLAACRLDDIVSLHIEDCGEFIRKSEAATYDFIFLDSDRSAYLNWSEDLNRVARFGMLVVDNATTHALELIDFKTHWSINLGFVVAVLPIGNGQMIIQSEVKSAVK